MVSGPRLPPGECLPGCIVSDDRQRFLLESATACVEWLMPKI
jgi:hypothetical protein